MIRDYRAPGQLQGLLVLFGLLLVFLVGCGPTSPPLTAPPRPPQTEKSHTITLGDIDPDEPAKKLKEFQPLADYLAQHLQEFGIREGRVVIARNFEDMTRLLKDGTVDIYFDSPFPTLAVQNLSGSQVIARRWKGRDPTYWSLYIALRDSGITSLEGFRGKIIALEEPHSTSGFVLPAGTLIQRGFTLRKVDRLDASVAPNEIGYFFSRDEENTIELLLQGQVAGGGVSNQDYQELSAELKQRILAFDQTLTVPRQLVSVRPGLDPALRGKVRELLIGLDQTNAGQQLLEELDKTKKFDPLPSDSAAALEAFKELMKLVSQ
jgi:phosphonate transport system substrate-binding protein